MRRYDDKNRPVGDGAVYGNDQGRNCAKSGNVGLEAFAFDTLTLELTGAANGFGLFAGAALGRLFVRTAEFHFTEDAFALHFLFQRFQGLIDIVIANGDLHGRSSLSN